MPAVDKFFDERSPASEVKAKIITKHFDTWSNIVLSKAISLGQKIAYMDLYCGPGRYDDGTESTPLLVLRKAIAKPLLAKHLVTIFNDDDARAVAKLEANVKGLPGITALANEPAILNRKVGQDTADYFLKNPTVPCFTFIDPFGYAGLTLDLIKGVTKNWGCDCIFFFNYRRINAALSTPIFSERMAALFGRDRTARLQEEMQGINASKKHTPYEREEIILDALIAALKELNKGKTYVRPFRFKVGKRTTHMLVFVTKHPLGYRIMNEIMAKEGFIDAKGIPHYTHYDDPPPKTQFFYPEFDELKRMLLDDYAGETKTMEQIYEEHSLGKNYIPNNYKDALNELEAEGKIEAEPPADDRPKRHGKPTFGDNTKVTFPPRRK